MECAYNDFNWASDPDDRRSFVPILSHGALRNIILWHGQERKLSILPWRTRHQICCDWNLSS